MSHDRAFLDNVVTSTLVFEGAGRIGEYVGGYSDWLRQRSDRRGPAAADPTAAPEQAAKPRRRSCGRAEAAASVLQGPARARRAAARSSSGSRRSRRTLQAAFERSGILSADPDRARAAAAALAPLAARAGGRVRALGRCSESG